jgi:gliding motility-associated-like protein
LSFSDLEDNTTYDSDGDGIPNYLDPVDDYDPSIASLNVDPNTYIYLDTDGDGIVNINDTDDDGDGFLDSVELTCQTNPLRIESQPGDYDSDGIADCIDSDIDGDGVDNIDDLFPMNPFESADNDGDGIGDNIDVDDDNDGVLDSADAFPNDSSEWKDTDNDGIGDYADADFFNDGFADSRQIEVSGLLTPSTTGVESTWKITNINLHPYNVVSVYDKEGKVVFHTQNYKNEWDGSYKDTGNKVPSGSYHYKVHIYDLNQTFTGWLFIAY